MQNAAARSMCWHTNDGAAIGNIAHDNRACADDALAADLDSGQHAAAEANKRVVTHSDAATKHAAWGDV